MSTIKTPEQIAIDILTPTVADNGKVKQVNGSLVYRLVERAIRADRAQRPEKMNCDGQEMDNALAVEVYDCLKDRETDAAERAAEWVAENENGAFWDRFAGPMLDEIEEFA